MHDNRYSDHHERHDRYRRYGRDDDYHYRRSRESYAFRAGDPGPGPNRYRVRRSLRDRKFAGVCSGIARYFGWDVTWLRFGWVISSFFFFPIPIIAYFAAAVVMKTDNEVDHRPYERDEDARFWKTFSTQPKRTFSELKHRFRALDTRISDIEYTVTSDEYGLNRAFDDLEKK